MGSTSSLMRSQQVSTYCRSIDHIGVHFSVVRQGQLIEKRNEPDETVVRRENLPFQGSSGRGSKPHEQTHGSVQTHQEAVIQAIAVR